MGYLNDSVCYLGGGIERGWRDFFLKEMGCALQSPKRIGARSAIVADATTIALRLVGCCFVLQQASIEVLRA
jgi:hypothetical protein